MNYILKIIVFLFLSISVTFSVAANPIYELDFSKASGDVEEWFEAKNWEFSEDMDDMKPYFSAGKLVIEPKSNDLGIIVQKFEKGKFIKGVTRLRIEWGVDQYPSDSEWEGPKDKVRNTREAISVMLLFGDVKLDSGIIFAPDLPYFISFFYGKNAKPNKVYFGNYWQEGGRYICIPCDGKTGKTVVTEINVSKTFKDIFGIDAPDISGLNIEVDVQSTDKVKGYHSKAFIKNIQLLGPKK